MKILFLDIDGVVNCKETFTKGVQHMLDDDCAERVRRIVRETGCLVVLSSSWRGSADSRAEIEKRVTPIHDITGRCCSGIRGVEINNWINKNIPYKERDALQYAILDDDSDMLMWQEDQFFQTSFEDGGLNDRIAGEVIAYLNRVI